MDQSLFFQINHHWIHPWADIVMATASSWSFWVPFAILGGIVLFFFGGFRGRATLVCIGLSIGLVDGLVVNSLKKMSARPRPHQVLEGARMVDLADAKPRLLALAKPLKVERAQPSIQPIAGRSFPSGHAANNFTLATVLIAFYRRWGWLYLIPATLVSYSRIYVASHYPSDIIVSILLAIGCTLLVLAAAEALWRRFAPRLAPGIAAAHPSLIAS